MHSHKLLYVINLCMFLLISQKVLCESFYRYENQPFEKFHIEIYTDIMLLISVLEGESGTYLVIFGTYLSCSQILVTIFPHVKLPHMFLIQYRYTSPYLIKNGLWLQKSEEIIQLGAFIKFK